MDKESFISACKTSVKKQLLTGNIMSYVEYDGKNLCPFCCMPMKAELKKGKLLALKCDCEKAVEVNKQLNDLIKKVEDAQDECMKIYSDIDLSALKLYKLLYQRDIHKMLLEQLEQERLDILTIKSLN